MRKTNLHLFCALAAFGLLMGTGAPTAHAASTRTWTGNGASTAWNDTGNWGGAAPASGDSVIFSGSAALTQLISLLDAAYTLNSLVFNTGTSGRAFTVTAGGANRVLSIGGGGMSTIPP